jgi:cholesterol oxidase
MCNTARSARRTDVILWKLGGPFDVKPLNDVLVILGAGYGGGSLIYANCRCGPLLTSSTKAGGRASLDPRYDLVARSRVREFDAVSRRRVRSR